MNFQVLRLVADPTTRSNACRVLEHMLLLYLQPLPTAFHSVSFTVLQFKYCYHTNLSFKLLKDFEEVIEILYIENDKETLENVSNIIYGLIHIYSGFPDLYLPIIESLTVKETVFYFISQY